MPKKNTDSLCWYCKRCPSYGIYKNQFDYPVYNKTCPWLEKGQPVDGWTAKPGELVSIPQKDGTYKKERAYCVQDCPMFQRATEYTTYWEVLDMVEKATGYSYESIHQRTERCLKKFEERFKTKLPAWVWLEYYFKNTTEFADKYEDDED